MKDCSAGVLAKIHTMHLPTTGLQRYLYTILLNILDMNSNIIIEGKGKVGLVLN
jgi:hypothetical protein